MLVIPGIYKDANENYITLPVINNFLSDNKISNNSTTMRGKLLDCIENWGNESESNKETVLNWIDNIILEGIKDIHVKYYPLEQNIKTLLKDKDAALSHFRSFVGVDITPHVCTNSYSEELALVSIRWVGEGQNQKIVFTYCKKLFTSEMRNGARTTKPIDYPIIAEYYIEGEYLMVIAKPRSKLYEYDPAGFNPDMSTTIGMMKKYLRRIEKHIPPS